MIEHIDASEILEAAEGDTWLRMRGDGMAPDIKSGDWLLGRPVKEPADNTIVIAVVGEKGTCRRYRRDGDTVHLLADNETVERITAPAGDVKVLGRVVGVVRRL